MLSAVIFPAADPEMCAFDLTEQMRTGIQRGLRLYYNGRQFGLFPRCPTSGGWIAFVNGQRHPSPGQPPCAA